MALKIIGKKKGMTRLFDENGNHVVCTVISAEPNQVTQIKSKEVDGYDAVQLSAVKAKSRKNVTKPLQGHFQKAGIEPNRHLIESRIKDVDSFQLGQSISVNYFNDETYVDVQGISKGKGYQGVMKRHHFSGGPASHGSGFHRHAGSTGMRSTPGRCLPGVKKAGRMGGDTVTVQNLRIVRVDEQRQLIIVEGAVPGPLNGLVYITKAKKKSMNKKKNK
jgi:large subunit ribosomal protein L3